MGRRAHDRQLERNVQHTTRQPGEVEPSTRRRSAQRHYGSSARWHERRNSGARYCRGRCNEWWRMTRWYGGSRGARKSNSVGRITPAGITYRCRRRPTQRILNPLATTLPAAETRDSCPRGDTVRVVLGDGRSASRTVAIGGYRTTPVCQQALFERPTNAALVGGG
jgi:hypothetical protein